MARTISRESALDALALYREFGTKAAVARTLGVDPRTAARRIDVGADIAAADIAAAMRGWSHPTMPTERFRPDGLGRDHLVIGDSHSKPQVSNERYDWLGRLIVDRKPAVIVDLGDWADMPSLCSYDKGKRRSEGTRYVDDVAAAQDARWRVYQKVQDHNREQVRLGLAEYWPEWHHIRGNHEERIVRATQDNAQLHGALSVDDLRVEEYGWRVHPFLEPVVIDGVIYSHYFGSGLMMRPIAGENPAAMLIKKSFSSCTAGHSHIRDFAERTTPDGRRLLGLIAGCYFEHWEDYAGPANNMYWRGLVLCRNVNQGSYEPEFIGMDQIKRRYA